MCVRRGVAASRRSVLLIGRSALGTSKRLTVQSSRSGAEIFRRRDMDAIYSCRDSVTAAGSATYKTWMKRWLLPASALVLVVIACGAGAKPAPRVTEAGAQVPS